MDSYKLCGFELDYDKLGLDYGREYHSNSSLTYKRKIHIRTSDHYYYSPNESVDDFDTCSKDYIIDLLARDLARWLVQNDYVKITEVRYDRDVYTYGYMQELEAELQFKLMEMPRRYKKKLIIERR